MERWGVKPRGLSTTSRALWKATGGKMPPRYTGLPLPPLIPRIGCLRGRLFYDGEVTVWDISGAYADAFRTVTYPSEGYDQVDKLESADAWVFATVWIYKSEVFPPAPIPGTLLPFKWSPLPLPADSTGSIFPIGKFTGLWLASELLMAKEAGTRVEIQAVWEPAGRMRRLASDAWTDAITEGRALPGVAGKLAKRTANVTWGTFASQGVRRNAYPDGHVTQWPERQPYSLHVADLVMSYVRRRLWREVLITIPVLATHTDSAIVPSGYIPVGPLNSGLGSWRIKEEARSVLIVRPGMYRFGKDKGYEYVCAGAGTSADARRAFKGAMRWANEPPIGRSGRHRLRNNSGS